jgi:hypothetical protein
MSDDGYEFSCEKSLVVCIQSENFTILHHSLIAILRQTSIIIYLNQDV